MEVRIYGARGSVASPGPEMIRYGGNTSCVHMTLSDGTHVVLDAGTGIRNVDPGSAAKEGHIHILLTHLHLDHIQGLLFFSPLFQAGCEVTIWGPAAGRVPLRNRIGRYLSAPLTPVEVRELPCELDFRNCPVSEWEIGPSRLRPEAVTHRGPTLGFRIEDAGASVCYLPDHEPALVGGIEELDTEWLSGYALARDADLLLHDCQYTDDEYPSHFGWGHSSVSQALAFAERCQARRTALFHHDPSHTDDQLDEIYAGALSRWERSASGGALEMAVEGAELDVVAAASASGTA
jgi:phosphoribosyl 1,2-cyclic phosphodiesterase